MKKAFTLVELLLVMMILGTILGMILNRKLINYRRVYMGYQKKATEDVVNATNLVLYRYPSLRDFGTLMNEPNWQRKITNANLTNNNNCGNNNNASPDKCIRAFYESALKGKPCDTLATCKMNTAVPFHTCRYTYAAYRDMPAAYASNDCNDNDGRKDKDGKLIGQNSKLRLDAVMEFPTVGIRMKNGEVIMFKARNDVCNSGNPNCFMVFVDMNGSKGPNLYGQDRYRFFVDYQNNVIHENKSDLAYINPNGLSDEENAILDKMRIQEGICQGNMTDKCKLFVDCYRKYIAIPKSQVSECREACGDSCKQ